MTMTVAIAVLSRRFRIESDGTENVRQRAFTTLQPHPGMTVYVRERDRAGAPAQAELELAQGA